VKSLATLESLEVLGLDGTHVTDIASLARLPSLQSLGVEGTKMPGLDAFKGRDIRIVR
jgi:hypothetical protein